MRTSPYQGELLRYTGGVATEVVAPAFVSHGRDARHSPVLSTTTLKLAIGPGKRSGPLPLVSCLMVTKSRLQQAQLAIGCFRRQTWPSKELVILDESADDRLADWIHGLGDPAIRLFSIRGTREVLGSLRNRSIELATGSFVCQWDDDDLQHPARLEIAMAAMAVTRRPVSFLARQTLWAPLRGRVAVMGVRPYENTVLAARAIMPRYPHLPRAEDTPVSEALFDRYPPVLVNLPELYIYVVHGRNTWDESHMNNVWQLATNREEGSATEATLAALGQAYPIAEYATLIKMRGAHGLRSGLEALPQTVQSN